MAKKPVVRIGLLNTESRPSYTWIPQRGVGQGVARDKKPSKHLDEERQRLAPDGGTYKRLRLHTAGTDQAHQRDIRKRFCRIPLTRKCLIA